MFELKACSFCLKTRSYIKSTQIFDDTDVRSHG